MRRLLLAPALLAPLPAAAGGVGLIAVGGARQARVYYYDQQDAQYLNLQYRPTLGTGLEVVLGDRDRRVLGLARAYFLQDAPPTDPPDPAVPDPTYAIPTEPSQLGVFTVGVQWGLLPDPGAFQLHLAGLAGGGLLSYEDLEFLLVKVGVGAEYAFTEALELYLDANGALRYRKGAYPGADAVLGLRYLFD